jgi:hypothetical protein
MQVERRWARYPNCPGNEGGYEKEVNKKSQPKG